MNIQKDYIVICENFILGQHNLPSLINLVEHINTDNIPITMQKLTLVGRFITDEKNKSYSVAIKGKYEKDESYSSINTLKDFVKVKDDGKTLGLVVTLGNYVFNDFGTFVFEIYFDDNLVGKTSIEIRKKNKDE